jgi:hypothetical protein
MSGIMGDMDAVPQSLWSKNNDVQMANTISKQVGMMSSAWEHRIPEMLFTNEENPGEAVSAVKALAIASAEEQRIYHVTKDNVNAVLPVLNISSEVKNEIRDSVAVGKVATVSQNNITVSGWTGVGYIIADAETGAGAYRISGGSNGGLLIILGVVGIIAIAGILAGAGILFGLLWLGVVTFFAALYLKLAGLSFDWDAFWAIEDLLGGIVVAYMMWAALVTFTVASSLLAMIYFGIVTLILFYQFVMSRMSKCRTSYKYAWHRTWSIYA